MQRMNIRLRVRVRVREFFSFVQSMKSNQSIKQSINQEKVHDMTRRIEEDEGRGGRREEGRRGKRGGWLFSFLANCNELGLYRFTWDDL